MFALTAAITFTSYLLLSTALAVDDDRVDNTVHVRSPLDSVPGLGKSLSAANRDDVIALWEAYRREEIVRECMARAGFEYTFRDILATGDRRRVETYLGIVLPEQVSAGPSESSGGESGSYGRALYGADAFKDEDAREERGDFGGGCDAAAWSELPSLWALKTRLGDEQVAMYEEINASLADAMKTFAACAASEGVVGARRPEDLRELVSSGTMTPDEVARASQQCSAAFEAERAELVYDAEKRFVDQYASLVESQISDYAGSRRRIAQDVQFLDFVTENG